MTINIVNSSSNAEACRILEVITEWVENDATWIKARDITDPEPGSVNWTTPGGDFTPAPPSADFNLYTTTGSKTINDATFQNMARRMAIASNWLGWLIKRVSESAPNGTNGFTARDNATSGNRPSATFAYLSLRRALCMSGAEGGGIFGSFNAVQGNRSFGLGYN